MIGRITTDGSISEYGPLTGGPFSIAAGPDGALWFTEPSNNKIGRITTQGSVIEYPLPPSPNPNAFAGPDGITAGSDGALWFTEPNTGKIGRSTTAGVVNEYQVASIFQISTITAGPDGALWFVDTGTPGRITTSGAITRFGSGPAVSGGVTVGPDGALWWPEISDLDTSITGLKRITTTGATTEYTLPPGGFLDSTSAIATGPDGALWFTDTTGIIRATGFSTGSPAQILSPLPGSTLAGSTITFNWQGVLNADNYWLDVGNNVAQGDISAGTTTGTSKTVSGIPCDGRTIYVQLWTHLNGAWQTPQRYTYAASSTCSTTLAQITSPTPGTTLTGSAVTFTWNSVFGADMFWLDVGNSLAHGDISAGATSTTSKTAGGLPCDGRTIYVQLWTHLAGAWQPPQRYTYTAASGCSPGLAQIVTPVPGTSLAGSSVTFSWNPVFGADMYWLDVGNSVAQGDISAGSTGLTSKTVSGLPCDGRIVYVQLWTHVAGTWLTPQRYTYTASTTCNLGLAQIFTPIPGTSLAGSTVTFTWNAVFGADLYWLDVGNGIAQGDISAGSTTITSKTANGIPCDGRTIYVQLWTHLAGVWQTPQRYMYMAPAGCAF
jgi:hypothetical protein